LKVLIVAQEANANLCTRFDKFSVQLFESLKLEMTIEKIQEAETMMFKPISKLVKVIIFFAIEQREIKYLIIGNTVLE